MALESGTVPLKVFIRERAKVLQTRRVALVNPTLAHVREVVSEWTHGPYKLTYTDSDNDQVTVETETEWDECKRLWASREIGSEDALHLTCVHEKGCKARRQQQQQQPDVYAEVQHGEDDEDHLRRAEIVGRMLEKLYGENPLLQIGSGQIPHTDWMNITAVDGDVDVDFDIPVLLGKLDTWGHTAFEKGDFENASDWYRFRSELDSDPGAVYNLACARARMDDFDGAFEHLAVALERGVGLDTMEVDSDLVKLREIPDWRARLEPGLSTKGAKKRERELQREAKRLEKLDRKCKKEEEKLAKKLEKELKAARKAQGASRSWADTVLCSDTEEEQPPAAAATTPEAPAAVADVPEASGAADAVDWQHQYAEQIRLIAEVGLPIDDRVLGLLREHDGNVHQIITTLLE